MRFLLTLAVLTLSYSSLHAKSILAQKDLQKQEGYFDIYYSDSTGKLYLEVVQFDSAFLFVHYLSQGLGSNDIGLDRGKLGGERLVKFQKMGDKIMLVQPNLKYRALSDNPLERKSVEEAFAKSVLFGFPIKERTKEGYLIELTDFLLSDLFSVAGTLERNKQGSYSLDKSRSAIHMEKTKAFPNNVEFDALLTFKGKPKGSEIWSVTPTAKSVTTYQHISFVKLPEAGFEMREWHPQCGSFAFSYHDYSSPITEGTEKKFIYRHRLEKKDPTAEVSGAVEPIIYYLDNGTPEPVRSALLDGGRWWNQAFEAIGYKDTFQFKILPDSIDPLDIRYNVVQWVHRSTRGWSYGATVSDPRTGEIIKGHVSLGSLRIRQDFKIAQALSKEPFKDSDSNTKAMEEMALARIRQLAAHEIGHTLGFAHNFSASTNDRASVMDYPHPTLSVKDGAIDFSNAYATGIGEWDKVTVAYSYQDYSSKKDARAGCLKVLKGAFGMGHSYLSDADARPQGGSSADAHLWDNGTDAISEFRNVVMVRSQALQNFSIHNIRSNESLNELEDLFVLVYYFHRYQTEALVKLIGGQRYHYGVKGDDQEAWSTVSKEDQLKALHGICVTLQPNFLRISESTLSLLQPRANGRGRESFESNQGPAFDAISAARASTSLSLDLLLHPHRLNRMVQQKALNEDQLGLDEMLDVLIESTIMKSYEDSYDQELQNVIQYDLIASMCKASLRPALLPTTKAILHARLNELLDYFSDKKKPTSIDSLCAQYLKDFFENPQEMKSLDLPELPDGSPIGSFQCGGH